MDFMIKVKIVRNKKSKKTSFITKNLDYTRQIISLVQKEITQEMKDL